ncbi:hypothetical protein [Actinoplanes sp. NPDC026619]|uniref:hypothetical protein n=1 Tax=Actinoplanes sp. NPDC026619 TaxID=3155798 RepID=UPI0033D48A36
MVASSTEAKSSKLTNPLLWSVISLAELLVVIVIYTHRGDSPSLGTPVTQILAGIAVTAVVLGGIVEWRELTGPIRRAAAIGQFAGAATALAAGASFIPAGLLAAWSPLMLHTAVMMILVGRSLLRGR